MHNTANCASREKSFMWFLREVSSEIHVKFMWKLTWFSHKFNGKSLSREIFTWNSCECSSHEIQKFHVRHNCLWENTIYNSSLCCKSSPFEISLPTPKSREKNRKEKSLHALISLSAYNVGLRGLYLDE